MEASTSGTAPGRTVDLAPLQEYRFELEHKSSTITLTLLSGSAEVCGWELRLGVSYHFSTCLRAALFTFTGCTLKVYPQNLAASTADSGSGDEPEGFTDYTANEAPVPSYLELHLALERQRVLADYNAPDDKPSPRVLIVGEKESGKTTLAKTLVNWTVRSGRARSDNGPNADDEGEGQSRGCLFVNLDPSMGCVSVPSSLAITPIYSVIPTATPVHPFGHTSVSGLAAFLPANPAPNPLQLAPPVNAQIFDLGSTEWSSRPQELRTALITRIGALSQRALQKDDGLFKGGIVIDTPAEWSERKHGDMVKMVVRAFEVNTIVVLGSEKLMVEMERLMRNNQTVTVLRAPKSGGVVDLDAHYRKNLSQQQFHSYFYGGPPYSVPGLSPHSYNISFEHLKVYRLAMQYRAPDSALPIGASRSSDTELEEIDPADSQATIHLANAVAILSQAADDAGDLEKLSAPVLGFIHISEVDQTKKKFTILSPSGGRLPRRKVLLTGCHWLPK